MTWLVEGWEVVDQWAARSSDPDAMWGLVMWFHRLQAGGPYSGDDNMGDDVWAHVEPGGVLVTYAVVSWSEQKLLIDSVLDVSG